MERPLGAGDRAAGPARPERDSGGPHEAFEPDGGLLWPALVIMVPLLLGPLFVLLHEAKPHVAGRLGGDDNAALTLANYTDIAGRNMRATSSTPSASG